MDTLFLGVLMLFLAVTLGFFVENQREHFIEHKREKQFIVTLVEDLKSDTTQLATGIETASKLIEFLIKEYHLQ